MLSLLILPLSLLADRLFGEPKRFHPLIGFGTYADTLASKLNRGPERISKGIIAWCLAVIPAVIIVVLLDRVIGGWWISILCGYIAIGWQSLRQHGQWIEQALNANDLPEAREKLSWIVSRDTQNLEASDISRGGIESILENGSDAIFAPLFWLAVGGAPLVVLYRLCNTLDAMWGYRNAQFEQFGKFSARMDDLLNLIPARLCAISYALMGSTATAFKAWRMQAGQWYSPNAGVVMATGAGALEISLGGRALYQGQLKQRPELGIGKSPSIDDLSRALKLVDHSVYLWGMIALLFAGMSLIV